MMEWPARSAGLRPLVLVLVLVLVPVLALAMSGLLLLVPLHQRWSNAADDAVLRLVSRASAFDDVLVIDIDDASLRVLQRPLGSWPYHRDVYALLLDYLRDAGARLVVFDIVFADPREGDDVFAKAIARRADTVLAAAGLREALERDDRIEPDVLQRLSVAASAGLRATRWPAMTMPAPRLLAASPGLGAMGVMSSPLDADRSVRRLPLLHESGGRVYPSLPVAARLRLQHLAAMREPGPPALPDLSRWWPDRNGMSRILLPSNAGRIPTLPWARIAADALGQTRDDALRHAIAGRTLFIGSSAFLADTVMTAQGDLNGTALLANAFAALGRDDVARPAPLWLLAGLHVLALSPSGLWWRRHRPVWWMSTGAIGLALIAIVSAAMAALYAWKIQASPLPAITTLLALVLGHAALRGWSLAQANRRLADHRRLADAANAAKSQFLANVSHELRTPLNAVLGMAEVLLDTELSSDQRRYANLFRSSGLALARLIDDLLDFSKIEADKLQLDIQPFSLHQLLTEQIALLAPGAVAKGISLSLSGLDRVDDVVQGDARRLAQVLVNLVGNAIKFTGEGGVVVGVERQADRAIAFEIRDSGIGIAADRLDAVFQPFVQVQASISRQHGGTGLGLSIAKRLIEVMGGQISVVSQPGVGSTFRFAIDLPPGRLPVRAGTAAHSAAAIGALPPPAGAAISILLAEDNEVNAVVVQAMLARTPHRIAVAADGREAVGMYKACLDASPFGLILMDVQMPGMDGLAAARAIRDIEGAEGRPRTAIVALTANAFADDERASLEAGCDGHLSKPVDRQRLLDAINRFGVPDTPAASRR
jgi:signal transduction histidine kinase/ActR/RegA family two-component response regulator